MSLLESCKNIFQKDNLYDILGLPKDALPREIKRGYHRLSLAVHPDRVSDEEKSEATQKFQTLGRVYSILSDTERRAAYDETGTVDDEDDVPQDRDWYQYWRVLFTAVTIDDIVQFEEKYKGSDEELEDLKAAYLDCEGDMDTIMGMVLCATIDDEPRFYKIIKKLIKKKELPDFEDFSKENTKKKQTRKKKAAKEAEEAEVAASELGLDDNPLQAVIKRKQDTRKAGMDDFFANLEAKYAAPKSSKSQSARGGKKRKSAE